MGYQALAPCYVCHRPTHPRELVGQRKRRCLRCLERQHEARIRELASLREAAR